ncbi:MAG: sulfatase-like hydrolase/transferase, partial [Draconibacterium sp.]|nr:sulfatase-like hydrolase/transferase [Draconibacterium sp.]
GSEIKTPVIDKLAKEGIQLDRFYVHSVCSPTRASLLTGRAPSRYGVLSPLGDEPIFPAGTVTIAELLKRNGYETAISGKWHLGTVPEARPMKFGFNSSYGYLRGQIDPYTHLYKNGNKTWHKNDILIDEEGHATDLITDEAIRVINDSHKKDKPLFIYVAYSVPHYPLAEPEKWIDMYKQSIPNESRRLFAASVTHMDYSIGRIITTLNKNKMLENTVVLFVSDNGGQESWHSKTQYNGKFKGNDVLGNNKPLRDWKTSLYDGALRVPAIISWKGKLDKGKVTEALNVADLFPTFASVAGVKVPKELNIEGINFWTVLSGNKLPKTRVMYWRLNTGMVIKKGDWKLIHHGKTLDSGTDELFNILIDPYETENIAEGNEAKVIELKKVMKQQLLLDSPVLAKEIKGSH